MTIKIQTIYSIRNDTQEVIQHYLSAMSALNRETWSISSRDWKSTFSIMSHKIQHVYMQVMHITMSIIF